MNAHKCESPAATGQNANQTNENVSIIAPAGKQNKSFATAQAQFALKGHTLQRSIRAYDGRVTYVMGRWGQSRVFTHWNDVQGFLAQIGGAA